jgi:hypothetical protein
MRYQALLDVLAALVNSYFPTEIGKRTILLIISVGCRTVEFGLLGFKAESCVCMKQGRTYVKCFETIIHKVL